MKSLENDWSVIPYDYDAALHGRISYFIKQYYTIFTIICSTLRTKPFGPNKYYEKKAKY